MMARLTLVVLCWLSAWSLASAADYSLLSGSAGGINGSGGSGNYHLQSISSSGISSDVTVANWKAASGYIAQVRLSAFINATPTLDALSDITILEDSGITSVSLSGITDGSVDEDQELIVTATSDNPALILNPSVTYTSPDTTGTLNLSPVADQVGTATITVKVTDAGGTLNGAVDEFERSFVVTVAPVNDAPTIDVIADVTVAEDSGLETISIIGISSGASNENQNLTITAVSGDTAKIAAVNVNYTSPGSSGSLSFTPEPNEFGDVTIVVTVADDGGSANGGIDTFTRSFTVTITPDNDPPVLTTNAGLLVEENRTGFITFGLLQASDDDPPTAITYLVDSAPSLGNLQVNGSVITAGESFTQEDINSGLVSFFSTGGQGTTGFNFRIQDAGGLTTASATFTITVVPASSGPNDPPVVTLPGVDQTYAEGDSPLLLDSAATVTDADGSMASGSMTVSLISGGTADDRLAIRNQGTGAGQIGVSGNLVTFEGSTIGAITSNGVGTNDLVITFNTVADPAAAQALARAIQFSNVSSAPSTNDRVVQFVAEDGDGGISAPVTTTVQVQALNSAPVVAFAQTTLAYLEDSGAVNLDAAISVVDVDSPDLNGGNLRVAFGVGGTTNDTLWIENQGSGIGQIAVSGSNIAYEGIVIGTAAGGTSLTPLVISFNSAADDEAAQALARALTYENSSDNPDISARQLELTVEDGDGGTSTTETLPISITRVNDDPVLALPTPTLAYPEGAGVMAVTSDGTVSDIDSLDFDTGFLRVAIASGSTASDTLDIANIGTGVGEIGVSGTILSYEGVTIGSYSGQVVNANPLVATLNNLADDEAVEALMRAVRYNNASSNPTSGNRVIEFLVTDGDGGSSTPRTVTMNVNDSNNAPVLTLSIASTTYVEDSGAMIIDSAITVIDGDSANFDGGALVIDIISGSTANDSLDIESQGFGAGQVAVTGSDVFYSGSQVGSVTGTGTDSLRVDFNFASSPDAAAAIASVVSFMNSSNDPVPGNRTISYVVTDGDGDASITQTLDVDVNAVNDAPAASNSAVITIDGVPLQIQLPGADAEGDGMTFVLLSQPSGGSVTLDDPSTGLVTFTPGTSDGQSFTYQITDGTDTSSVITVDTEVTSRTEARPHPVTSPPLAVAETDVFAYPIEVDNSLVDASADLEFYLTGNPPAGMTLTKTGTNTAVLNWMSSGTVGDHQDFGVVFVDPVNRRAGYQPVMIVVTNPVVVAPGGGG